MSGMDDRTRTLWRAFVASGCADRDAAFRWALSEARLRGEAVDPPEVDRPLAELHALFDGLSAGACGLVMNALVELRVRELTTVALEALTAADARSRRATVRAIREKARAEAPARHVLLLRDVADRGPSDFLGKGVSVGPTTMVATAYALEILGVGRPAWADFVTRARLVFPKPFDKVTGRIGEARTRYQASKRTDLFEDEAPSLRAVVGHGAHDPHPPSSVPRWDAPAEDAIEAGTPLGMGADGTLTIVGDGDAVGFAEALVPIYAEPDPTNDPEEDDEAATRTIRTGLSANPCRRCRLTTCPALSDQECAALAGVPLEDEFDSGR